jgi:hypothetical protein
MPALNTFTAYTRILQVVTSIISIGINGKLTSSGNSLDSSHHLLNQLVQSSAIQAPSASSTPSYGNYFSSSSKPQVLTLVTSSYTLLSHFIFSWIAPSLLTLGNNGLVSSPREVHGLGTAVQSFGEKLFAGGLAGSEFPLLALWFSSFTYQTAEYGSWSCGSVENLLTQYNVTDDITTVELSEFLGYNFTAMADDSSHTTNNTDINKIIGSLFNITSNNKGLVFSNWNETSERYRQELLIDLSQDCQLKKASIGISSLGAILFFFSSGAVVISAVQMYIASTTQNYEHEIGNSSRSRHNYYFNTGSITYSIVSTFAHLKPSSPIDSANQEVFRLTQDDNMVAEIDTVLPNGITLRTTTELETVEHTPMSDASGRPKASQTFDKVKPLFILGYNRAILFPTLERRDS